MIGIVSDITERKEVEKTLKENENRLKELNETKDKFFSIIAHDLKSPFISIIGLSELLSEDINEKSFDKVDEYAKMIHQSSRRAMELLSNLFEWSKLQTGSIEFNPEEIDIVSVINEAKELLSYAAWHKSITISTRLPDSFNIKADKNMISSVLRNLISNALKFTYPDGRIEISAAPYDNELIVTVSDNGVGIKESDVDKLFRLDVSYSVSGTKGEQGTGLGLILCKDFISRHGGRIWVESEIGKGSHFHFSLPYITKP
jgi:signal transduction histidine kinase